MTTAMTPEAKRALLKTLVKKARSQDAPAEAPALPPQTQWRAFSDHPGYLDLKRRQHELVALGIDNPYFATSDGIACGTARVQGRELVTYSTYNYLGLAGEARVSAAAKAAIDQYGTSASASRIAAGERPVYQALEVAIAATVGVDAALTFVGGHATNVAAIGHLFGPGDLLICDSLIHNSVLVGCQASGARQVLFPHNDMAALEALMTRMRADYQRVVVLVEGVYSMDGDIAPLDQLLAIKARHDVMLFVDEAHSLGVLGARGRGLAEHFGIDPASVDIWMGTLSKALASCGGYIAGSAALIEYLKYTTPGFIYTCGLPPATAAAALAALAVIAAEPERVSRLRDRARLFLELARSHGLNTGLSSGSAVVPIIVGDSMRCLRLSNRLRDAHGLHVMPVIYPAVEDGASRLRFFLSEAHSEAQVRTAVAAVVSELAS